MTVVIEIPGEIRPHRVELVIENYRRGLGAITHGPSDTWEPAESTQYDVIGAYTIYGGRYRLLPRKIREKIAYNNEARITKALDQ